MFKRKPDLTTKTSFISAMLGLLGAAFAARSTVRVTSRHKGGRRPGRVRSKKGYAHGIPGHSKMAKKIAQGTLTKCHP